VGFGLGAVGFGGQCQREKLILGRKLKFERDKSDFIDDITNVIDLSISPSKN